MKNSVRGFLAVLAVIVSAVSAWGAGAPVVLTHSLTGYSKAARTVTLEYTLQVLNKADASVGPLTLTLVPHPPVVTTKTSVTVDSIAPKATATAKVTVVTPLLMDEKSLARKPLLWAGKYTDANGKVIEFPVKSEAAESRGKSKPGGDR